MALPFGCSAIAYKKLVKLKSITNWKMRMNKKLNFSLMVEYWTKGTGDSEGCGIVAGVKDGFLANFGKTELIISEIHYDADCDSWLMKDKEGNFYRAAWANAYQNPKYPHHENREEVNQIISTAPSLKVW